LTVAGSVRGKLRELSSFHADVEEPTLRALRETLGQGQERPGPLRTVGPRFHVGNMRRLVQLERLASAAPT